MIRIIFMALVFYFIMRVVNTVLRAVKAVNQRPERTPTTSEPATKTWNRADVVDAEFTEIPNEKKS